MDAHSASPCSDLELKPQSWLSPFWDSCTLSEGESLPAHSCSSLGYGGWAKGHHSTWPASCRAYFPCVVPAVAAAAAVASQCSCWCTLGWFHHTHTHSLHLGAGLWLQQRARIWHPYQGSSLMSEQINAAHHTDIARPQLSALAFMMLCILTN